jgi:hypothetical protein
MWAIGMLILSVKRSTLQSPTLFCYFIIQYTSPLTFWPKKLLGIIFIQWELHEWEKVTLNEWDNTFEAKNHLLFHCPVCLTFDLLTSKSSRIIFVPREVHMFGMMALGERDYRYTIHCIYTLQKDTQPNSSINKERVKTIWEEEF